ncbi:hypothetical protein ACFX2H_027691 [Malus domestica]
MRTTNPMSTCSAYPAAMMTQPPKINSTRVSEKVRLLLLLPPDVVLEEMMMPLRTVESPVAGNTSTRLNLLIRNTLITT